MPDWKKAAQALAPEIPDAQLDAIAPSLDALEKAFRALPASLTAEDDAAPLFTAFQEEER